MKKRHLTLTPVLLLELILITCLFGVGGALAMSATTSVTSQGSWAGQDIFGDATYLEVSNYSLNYNARLTAVESVNLTISNSDASAAHESVARVTLGNAGGTVMETGSSNGAVAVPAGGTAMETIILDNALDLTDMDWIRVLLEDAA